MHDTHLGFHAPPRVNQLPMAYDPHDFRHIKEVAEGKTLVVHEEGADNLNTNTSTKFQKYFGKKLAWMYIGYDHKVDLKNDAFLNSLGKEEKKEFDEEMKKIWAKNKPLQHKEDVWYMILEGMKKGEKKVGLYQDEQVFKDARDAEFIAGMSWSSKGCWFDNLASAKSYIQMARDEEGVHWDWPKEIPVIWKRAPLTESDISNFPGWGAEGN
jgi:hypothetical protein